MDRKDKCKIYILNKKLTSDALRLDLVGADDISVEEKDALDLVTERASFANLLRPDSLFNISKAKEY